MASVSTYVNFTGQAEEAFTFYASVFGAELQGLQRYRDLPQEGDGEQATFPEPDFLIHVELSILGGHTLMGSDVVEGMGPPLVLGNNVSISLNPDSKEEADRLFAALSDGGTVHMPMGDTFWNAYFGMCADRFGIQWMINFPYDR